MGSPKINIHTALILRPTGDGRTIIAGIAADDLLDGSREDQMWYGKLFDWQGELRFVPLLKLGGDSFGGYTISQMLTGGYSDPSRWQRIIENHTGENIRVGGEE